MNEMPAVIMFAVSHHLCHATMFYKFYRTNMSWRYIVIGFMTEYVCVRERRGELSAVGEVGYLIEYQLQAIERERALYAS